MKTLKELLEEARKLPLDAIDRALIKSARRQIELGQIIDQIADDIMLRERKQHEATPKAPDGKS